MKWVKYGVRGILLACIVIVLFYLNAKTDDNIKSIAEFKIEMFEKTQTDSLNTQEKLNLVLNETTKFIEDSSRVRTGVQRLMGLLVLLVVFEIAFVLKEKRNSRQGRNQRTR